MTTKQKRRSWIGLAFSSLAILWLANETVGQSRSVYEILWWTVDGGGGVSSASGGSYELTGTIAQNDAGILSGGAYVLKGGFWPPPAKTNLLFTDGFESGDTSAWAATVP